MADEKLDHLKLKYQSVLNTINRLGVELQNLHLQENKLVIKGRAKTKADSNQIWEQIKLVDANYASDLMAQFTYDSEGPPAGAAAPLAPRTYTVEKGDTLSEIAQKFYGKSSEYRRIFEANRDQLSDPDKIRPGQVLKVPT
jgi:nucleoid-associated protein YgaU